MTRKILENCPSCGGPLEITEVHCTRCETQVRAHYHPCRFCSLSEEQSTFLHLFLSSRGNLSEVEKRLGVSYPTVRAKLDEVIDRLGAADAAPSAAPSAAAPADGSARRAILEAVARGELSAADGMARIRALGGEA